MTVRMGRFARIAGLIATCLLLIAACGDDDVSSEDPGADEQEDQADAAGEEDAEPEEPDTDEEEAEEAEEAPYFEGQRITLTSTYGSGGSGNQVAELHAEFLEQYIPGNPTVVKETRSGGGHTVGNNWFVENAETDGTNIVFSAATALDQYIRGGDHVEFDLPEYEFIGSLHSGSGLVVARPEAAERLEDPDAEPLVVGDTDGLRSVAVSTMFAARHLDYPFRWAIGYEGGADVELAFRRGETDVHGGSGVGALVELMEEEGAVPLWQLGTEREDDFPDVPTIRELLEESDSFTQDEQDAFEIAMTRERFDSFTALPPGTDPEVAAILEEAYAEMAQDPEFLEPISTIYGGDIRHFSGAEIGEMVGESASVDPEAQELLTSIRVEYGLPTGTDD